MIPFLVDDLKGDEGYARRLPNGDCQAYPDPLTCGAPWTIGYGCTGPGISEGTVWTQAQAEAELERRCETVCRDLDGFLPWWRSLGAVRAAVLANMAYNMGVEGLLGFHHMLAAAKAGDYPAAAKAMLASEWAGQVGERAARLAAQMRTGARAS